MSEAVAEAIQDTGSQDAAPAPTFHETLPEDIRNEPSLRNFTDAGSLAKSYVHAQRMIGADKVAIPGASATPDEWRAVYTKLGAPDKPDAYAFENVDEETVASMRQAAFDMGLTQAQANGMAEFYNSRLNGYNEAFNQASEQIAMDNQASLQKEWGKAFDRNLDIARNTATYLLGGTEMFDEIQLADGSFLGDHPGIIKMFHALGKEFGEDQMVGEATEMVMTPDEAQRKIAEMMAPGTPYHDKMHPEHDFYVQEVGRLFEYKVG